MEVLNVPRTSISVIHLYMFQVLMKCLVVLLDRLRSRVYIIHTMAQCEIYIHICIITIMHTACITSFNVSVEGVWCFGMYTYKHYNEDWLCHIMYTCKNININYHTTYHNILYIIEYNIIPCMNIYSP